MKKSIIICCFIWITVSAVSVWADTQRLVVDSGGHTSRISSVIFTRDGKYLISAGYDKTIRIWNLEEGKTVRAIRGWIGDGSAGKIYAMALSPDNRYLAVGGWMGSPTYHPGTSGGGRGGGGGSAGDYTYEKVYAIRIFDFQTGELIRTLEGSDSFVTKLAFTPSGNHLISGDARGHICVWLISPGQMKRLRRFNKHERGIRDIQVSPDGKFVASLSWDGSLKLWDVETALGIKDIGRQRSFAFSPDGLHIVSCDNDNRLLIWGAKDAEFKRELARFDSEIKLIAYNSDGTRVIAATDSACKVLLANSGKILTELKGNSNEIVAMDTPSSGTAVATAVRNSNAILLWSYEDGEPFKILAGKGAPVFAVGFAKDGRSIAFGNKSDYKGINNRGPLQSGFRFAQGDLYEVGFESQIKKEFLRATETNNSYVLKPADSSPFDTLQIIRNGQASSQIKTESSYSCYTFTPDGRYVIIGTSDGNIEVYKTESPKLAFLVGRKDRDLIGHTDMVWSLAVSPDGRTLLSSSADQTLRLWDIKSGKNILTMFVGIDNEWVAWMPEGYYTSSFSGDKYIGWFASQGTEKNAEYYSAAQFQKQYYRPGIVAEYLKSRDIKIALQQDNERLGRPPETAEAEVVGPKPDVDITTIVPPVVFFISPEEEESSVDDESLTVNAVAIAASNTPPVAEIKVFLNGTQVGSNKESQRKLSIKLPVSLQPGTNILSVIAQSEKATSEPVVRKIIYTGKKRAQSKPNLRVLAIGISKYKNPALALKFADKDAIDFESILKEQEHLRLLFNKVESKVILNEAATRQAIIDGLDWLSNPNEVEQGDVLLLFLSGHGGVSKDNYYFYTRDHDPDANPERDDIRWTILMDSLVKLPNTHQILFVDTCRAGAATGAGRSKGDTGITQALKDLENSYQGVVFFAASSSDEQSQEFDQLQHGAFTYALLEGLKGKADVLPADRIIYTNELGEWTRNRVKQLTDSHQRAIYSVPKPDFMPYPIIALPQ